MFKLRTAGWLIAGLAVLGCALAGNRVDQADPEPGLLRFPDASATDIVFVYANDLWLVPREGGQARPLASPPGPEIFPRFSPDGRTIAFMGNYDGNRDLYTIPVEGGVPSRVTYHPSTENLQDWTPDGQLLFSSNGFLGTNRISELFKIPSQGGSYAKLPVPYGDSAAISPDGRWLAYTPFTRDFRTWKRYRGGMATDIWLFDLQSKQSRRITEWEGTDTRPMWHGSTLYYLSDEADSHRLNIFAYDTRRQQRRQVTRFSDYDVKWPALGPGPAGDGEIVFQLGTRLMSLDLKNERTRAVPVIIPGDLPEIRPHTVETRDFISSQGISPTGKRALFSARGDIWTVPAENGSPRNLTPSSGSAERSPAWSPDGRWIAYFSDAQGEYDLYLRQADLRSQGERVAQLGPGFRGSIEWAPDSKKLSFQDEKNRLLLFDVQSRSLDVIDTDSVGGGHSRVSWSHDSNWMAFTRTAEGGQRAVFLHDLDEGATHQVTAGYFNDSWPAFDRKGDFLYLASNRDISSPIFEDLGGTTFVHVQTDRLLVVPLREDVTLPFAPKSDEETWAEESAEESAPEDSPSSEQADAGQAESQSPAETGGEEAEGEDGGEKLRIDLEGFESRAVPLPVPRGSFLLLAVNHQGHLLYSRVPLTQLPGNTPSIMLFDPAKSEQGEVPVVPGAAGFAMSADGKKILVQQGPRRAIVQAAPKQMLDKPLDLAAMSTTVDPRREWKQMFMDAWRLQRDFFYAENMHGVDWQAVRERYQPLLDQCLTRSDVDFVIDEMISELNVGHAYNFGGDYQSQPQRSVGLLGADFELHQGAYRIARIIHGAPWDFDARGPLGRPGVDVQEGDFVLAVNGVELDVSKDPYAAFQGLAGETVTLTVSDKPAWNDEAREVVVDLIGNERQLRYRHWVESNRRYVEEKSQGRVGYIYVPDTGISGHDEMVRQFHAQRRKPALLIDDRWNSGGFIPTRLIELLNRPVTNFIARRHGATLAWPPDAHHGPKAMLINGLAASGGDAIADFFKQAGLGPLIGTRTWGGLVGISGGPQLVDGGVVTVPAGAFFETDGTWGIEGHGVDPDIEVVDDPALMQDGSDPQIDAAIDYLLSELERNPFNHLQAPALPDRSGMGLPEEDK
ncbi:MAG TPA: PDZ domain-containing protein [Acidobacteriota bacterium]|nr:PDZ domain-containing protein [Acidobacteriota bacterium]